MKNIVKWKNGDMSQLRSNLLTMHHVAYQHQVSMVNHLDRSEVLNLCGHQKTVGKYKSIMKVFVVKKIRHVVAIMLKWTEILGNHERQKRSNSNVWPLYMCSVLTAEVAFIRLCQGRYFEKDINALCNGKSISKQSNNYKLDSFCDEKGILRVCGRIRKSTLE